MAYEWIFVYLLVMRVRTSIQISTPESEHYVAAVVEFAPERLGNDGAATVSANVGRYLEYIKSASENDADIIAFPEDGLTGLRLASFSNLDQCSSIIPAASENYVPCTQQSLDIHEVIKKISCAARDYHIYVVVNIAERSPQCGAHVCPLNQTIYYNTNVVFDRAGKVVARYRKVNLFDEPVFTKPKVHESVTFDTDFGVKFGTFICFDILFHTPPLNLTREQNVTDIVFTTAWFSEVPFLTAIQMQFGWSFAENVNMLVAGYNNPVGGSTGSGVYLGRQGIGTALMEQTKKTQMLIYRVPKVSRDADEKIGSGKPIQSGTKSTDKTVKQNPEEDHLSLLYDNLSVLTTADVKESTSENVCHGNFCCRFKIKMRYVDPNTKYKIGAFSGTRLFGQRVLGGVTVCAVLQCENDTVGSCAATRNTENVFDSIEITTKFDFYDDNLIFPSTLNSSLLPIQQISLEQHKHADHVHVTLSLTAPTKNLATFALYSRDFTKDGTSAAALSQVFHFAFCALSLFLSIGCIRLRVF